MNIIFFGSSQFGLPSLQSLLNNRHNVCCVVTQPDKKKGRGLSISYTPIKEFALKNNLPLYQPEKINTLDSINFLKSLKADLFIVIAYGQILSKEVLNIPLLMPVNLHASILPAYRGAAPINRAIINADKKTGISVIKMAEELDAGPVIFTEEITIDNKDTSITLENKLSLLAAECLKKIIDLIITRNYKLAPQDETKVSFAPKLKKKDGLIIWTKQAVEIYNTVRGCLGWPDAFTYLDSKLLKIYETEVIPDNQSNASLAPGQIISVSKNGILAATGKNNLLLKELQLEGKRRTRAQEFISGQKISPGKILG